MSEERSKSVPIGTEREILMFPAAGNSSSKSVLNFVPLEREGKGKFSRKSVGKERSEKQRLRDWKEVNEKKLGKDIEGRMNQEPEKMEGEEESKLVF